MSTLRWILLILGAVIVAAVYFIGRKKSESVETRFEPALDSDGDNLLSAADSSAPLPAPQEDQELVDFDELIAKGLEAEVAEYQNQSVSHKMPEPAPPAAQDNVASETANGSSMLMDQELVVLHLIAESTRSLEGSKLYQELHHNGFQLRQDGLFSCATANGKYLALNAIKPGYFPESPHEFSTKAVGLILRLSKVEQPLQAFDEFLAISRQLHTSMQAKLCDAQRSSLTNQTIAYLRDEVQQYSFKHRS